MENNWTGLLIEYFYKLEQEALLLCKDERFQILREAFGDNPKYKDEKKLLETINNNHKEKLISMNNPHLSRMDILLEKIKYLRYIRNSARKLLATCFGENSKDDPNNQPKQDLP